MSRYARRVDSTQAPIVKVLRQLGAYVVDTSRCGDGMTDLLVGWRRVWLPAEVKTATGTLEPKQEELRLICEARGLPHYVLRTQEDVMKMLGIKS